MIDETVQQQLLDYMDNTLSEEERVRIEALMTTDPSVLKRFKQLQEVSIALKTSAEWRPSAALRESFDAILQQELDARQQTKQVFLTPLFYRVAAAVVLLITVGGIGFWYNKQQTQEAELLALREEMKATRKFVFDLLQNDQSASQRMMGVKAAYETTRKDDAIVLALIRVMNEDANMNVRLSAVEALGKFSDEVIVQKALLESLPKQTDPAVQIALIQVLVQMKEQGAVKSLREIIEDETVIESVRDEAHAGIIKLS